MALISCANCGKIISSQAKQCPHCKFFFTKHLPNNNSGNSKIFVKDKIDKQEDVNIGSAIIGLIFLIIITIMIFKILGTAIYILLIVAFPLIFIFRTYGCIVGALILIIFSAQTCGIIK